MNRALKHLVVACAGVLPLGMHLVEAGSAVMADGSRQRVDLRQVKEIGSTRWPGWLALQLDGDRPDRGEPRSMLAFDDGQRVAGEFEGIGQELWWRHRDLGSMQIDLERLAWIGPPALASVAPPARDRVSLVNGDRIEGFVNALHADRGVEIESTGATANDAPVRTWYDLGKAVAAIQLVPRGHPPAGWRLWLRDGSVIDVDAWQRDAERVVLTGCHLPGVAPSVTIPWESLQAVQDPRRGTLALSAQPWKAADVADTPRLSPASASSTERPAGLDLRAIDLRGPGTFTATLPVTCAVDLAMEPAPALGEDVDCAVTVLDGDRVLASHAMKGAMKPLHLHETVRDGRLVIRLEAGARGAYGCGVRLSDGLIAMPVTEPSPASPKSSSAPVEPAPRAVPAPG